MSERNFYQKITDIYATSMDYDKNAETTREFFAKVQNKLHYAIHKHTAPELIVQRALTFCIFVPLLLLAVAQSQALDCSSTVNEQMCTEIRNANISAEEKAYLLADIMSFTKQYPDHQLVGYLARDDEIEIIMDGIRDNDEARS